MAAKIILNFKRADTFLGSKAYIELFNFTKANEGDFPQLSTECVTPKEIEDEAKKLKKQLDEVVRQAKVKFAQAKKTAQKKLRTQKP
jgi:hypothetical protein